MDGTPSTVIDQVFLTPRVLDARAFSEYATTLQDLLKQAAGHQASLLNVSSDMQVLRQGLIDTTNELQRRLDAAVKILPGVDTRLARAEKLVSEVDQALSVEPLERLRAMKLETSRTVFESLQQFQESIAAELTKALEQAQCQTQSLILQSQKLEEQTLSLASSFEERLHARIVEFEDRVRQYTAILDTQARLYDDRLTRRGEELEAKLQARAAEAERVIESRLNLLESRLMQFDTMLADTCERQAKGAISAVIDQASAIERRMAATVSETSSRLVEVEGSIDNCLKQAAEKAQTVTITLENLLKTTAPVLENAQFQADGSADRLGALLATARDFIESDQGGGAIREIRQLAARLDTVRVDSEFAARQFGELRKHADQARENLAKAILEAASGAEHMLSRSDELVARTRQCSAILQNLTAETTRAEQLAEIAAGLSDRSNAAELAIARLSTDIETLEAKKLQLEHDLRRTGELLDIADTSLAERYNLLGASIQRGTELKLELQEAHAQSLSTLASIKQEEASAIKRLQLARSELDQQIARTIVPLLTHSKVAAEGLENAVDRARLLEVSIPSRAHGGVSASALFPTAR